MRPHTPLPNLRSGHLISDIVAIYTPQSRAELKAGVEACIALSPVGACTKGQKGTYKYVLLIVELDIMFLSVTGEHVS